MQTEVTFTMSEMTRYGAIQALLEKKMTFKEAALALELSTRQIKRMKKKVIQCGPQALHHGNRGRPPSRAFSPEFKRQVIQLAQSRYSDFNFSHLSEILAEQEGIHINRETLRLWLRPLGLGRRIRRRRTGRGDGAGGPGGAVPRLNRGIALPNNNKMNTKMGGPRPAPTPRECGG